MLSLLDIVLAVLFLGTIALAGNFLWKTRGRDDYFLGGRNLPWPVILASIVATETSTLTFIGAPALAFSGDVTFLQLAAGYIVGRCLTAFLILPGYFRGNYRTAYELLSHSLGDGTRRLASSVFIVTRTLADGVRLYATGLVISIVLGIGIIPSLLIISGITILFTLRGGLVAVVWTDFLQLLVYLGGAVFALFLLLDRIPGGVTEVILATSSAGKLRFLDLHFFSASPFTLPAGLAGGAFLSMASHGTDHLMVQRLLAARDLGAARKALIWSGVFVFFQFALFLAIGLALYTLYQVHLPGTFHGKADEVFPFYIMSEVPSGAKGLIIAAVMAAAVSTLASSLNSLASSTWGDFLLPALRHRKGRSWLSSLHEIGEVQAGRILTLLWCIVLLFVSFLAQNWGGVLETGLAIASFTYGSLLGAFLLSASGVCGVSGGGRGVSLGMITGMAVMTGIFFLTKLPWTWYVVVGTLVTCAAGYLFARSGR
jgi:SSS family transporter